VIAGRAVLFLGCWLALFGCVRSRSLAVPSAATAHATTTAQDGAAAADVAQDGSVPPIDPAHLHAVLVNGGGNRSGNYQSHYLHVRSMLDVLASARVPHDQIAVFSSDGDDPGEDQAVRELRPEGEGWLLQGTPLEGSLGRPMEFVSTTIPGQTLHPATPDALLAWFKTEGSKIPPGDTLLFYVTDHGTPNREDPTDTRITMWGEKKTFSVRELRAALRLLDPGVRVVMLMSQCFSGGFAHLTDHGAATEPELPSGDVCGYFASTHDRPAYGCYPENRGAKNVGHSVRFIESLAANGSFPRAEAHTLVHDRTPDVPLRTSDVQLEQLLERVARAQGEQLAPYADTLLREAWQDPARFEPQIRLLDRMGQSFGFASPRSLAEVGGRLERLPTVADAIGNHADAWSESFEDATRANLTRYLDSHADMRARVAPDKVRATSPDAARALGSELLAELGPYTEADAATLHRLQLLDKRAEVARRIAYRMQVREAGLLRMRALLLRIAGEVYLASRATPAERAAFDALERCEDLDLDVHASDVPPPAPDEFPSYEDDLAEAKTVLPAWMGIQFRPVTTDERDKYKLQSGAVSVRVVYPDSPAAKAGLEVGDILLGPPGKPFSEPRQVREWTMLQEVGKPRPLEVLHDGKLVRRTLVPGEHPGKFPELPGPPRVGSAAPALDLKSYRGTPPTSLAGHGTHLLFFWATWCAPCKASLPEVLAFARERGVEVVAITDEDPATLDRFFAKFEHEFPPLVAIDPKRDAFLAYGVSGTPTFVLVDDDGVVRSISTGYTPAKGLRIEGWQWSERPAPTAAPAR
jgi:thiol-disulfide isomerase/thioredoxin